MRSRAKWALVLCLGAWLVAYGCFQDEAKSPTDLMRASAIKAGTGRALVSPLRIATDDGGSLLVADPRLDMVMVVDPATQLSYESFQVSGSLSVAVLANRVLVGNAAEGSLQYYDWRGRLRQSTGPGSVGRPTDIAVDAGLGLVFVVDAAARNIKVFDGGGRLQRTLGSPGLGLDQLMAPVGIAVDPGSGKVFVTDWGDFGNANGGTASIKIFSYDGSYIDYISGAGTCGMLGCSNGFSRPQGLAVDAAGRLYVADALLAQVLVIDPATKQVLTYLGGRPTLRLPTDVVLLGSDVLVASNGTASVEFLRGGVQP